MCGIFGYLDQRGFCLQEDLIKNMGQLIEYRGPDDQGIFWEDGVSLGNQRLSIIDIEGGHQPFYSDDKNIVLVQNGEVFNYIEIRRQLKNLGCHFKTSSDTEVLLKSYEHWGLEAFSKINGMFAVAIYHKKEKKLLLVRDRAGEKPLYWARQGERLYFSSEIKSILSALPHSPDINFESLENYLQLGYTPPPLTLFKGIEHILPGHVLIFTPKGIQQKRWWFPKLKNSVDQNQTDTIEELRSLFIDAVKLRMRADVPFGAFLSGGLDSSFNVAAMSSIAKKENRPQIKTFHISFPDNPFDEYENALAVAKKFNTTHKSITINQNLLRNWPKFIFHCDQPHADISFLPTLELANLATKDVKMVITGDGADELYAGYSKHIQFLDDFNLKKNPDVVELYLKRNTIISQSELNKLVSIRHSCLKDHLQKQAKVASEMDPLNQYLYIDFINLLAGNNLLKADRMGMASSLEARLPFMDYRLIEQAFNIPGRLKIYNGEGKVPLKKAAHLILEDKTVYQRKKMFSVPITQWRDFNLADLGNKILLGKGGACPKILNGLAIKKTIENYRQYPSQEIRKLRILISLELWMRIFLENQDYTRLEDFFS